MSEVYFSALVGADPKEGRASHCFHKRDVAERKVEEQNDRAVGMGIQARYEIGSADSSEFDKKDIRTD